jgi:hypothetical protein
MLENFNGFNIEPTNICTLKCPKCSRTTFLNKFGTKNWKNVNIDLDLLKKFIDIDISGKKIIICGNYGDAIYYNDLFPMVEWFKTLGANIELVTNGSYKTQEWWRDLVSLLDKTDRIVFSIDGIPENFTQYRINGDWKTIKIGIDEVVGKVSTAWKYIPFSFNENDIEKARELSKTFGIDEFGVVPSHRWDGNNDPLISKIHILNNKDLLNTPAKTVITPLCKKNKHEHFISATGFYTPCCPTSDYGVYYKSDFYKNRDKYDIRKTTFSKILEETRIFFETVEGSKNPICVLECGGQKE